MFVVQLIMSSLHSFQGYKLRKNKAKLILRAYLFLAYNSVLTFLTDHISLVYHNPTKHLSTMTALELLW